MKLDRNGYSPSIFPTEYCYNCDRGGDLNRHEVYFGVGNRTISKREGLWVNLCPECHRIVHEKSDDGELDEKLKRDCYKKFCETHSKEEFKKLIGRYYDD